MISVDYSDFPAPKTNLLICFLLLKCKLIYPMATISGEYDRAKEVIEFDESKSGVKGFIDSGIEKIPRIFLHPPENLPKPSDGGQTNIQIPVIDLDGIDDATCRRDIVEEVREASKSWGFFQLANHGIPVAVLDDMIRGVKMFHEQDQEVKAALYSRDTSKKVRYNCNFDLLKSQAANWRDTLNVQFDDNPLDPEEIPSVCREVTLHYHMHILKVAHTVFALLSEALGLDPDYLIRMKCDKTQHLLAHYYPPCPEPELTLGTSKHTDNSFISLLLQDDLGGLQVLHQNHWVDIVPVRGRIIVNIGDLLQLVSNDKFTSVEHRVLANREGPRISVAMFLYPSHNEERPYGPIKETLSHDNPPIYQEVLNKDYMAYYRSKGLGKGSALANFRLK